MIEGTPAYQNWLRESAKEAVKLGRWEITHRRAFILAACLVRGQRLLESSPEYEFLEFENVLKEHARTHATPWEDVKTAYKMLGRTAGSIASPVYSGSQIYDISNEHDIFELLSTDFAKVKEVMES